MSSQQSNVDAASGTPRIVHISNLHGYLTDARSALTTIGDSDTDQYPSLVRSDDDGQLH